MLSDPVRTEVYPMSSSDYKWRVLHYDRVSYGDGLDLQLMIKEDVQNGSDHHLLLLEHDPVITLGRRTDPSHLLMTEEELVNHGIELFRVNRGGSATYHGPGQLVGYIICKSSRLGGIHVLVSKILRALNQTVTEFGIPSVVDEENPGIWTDTDPPRKLAAVGMSNTKGYTMHGFAINIDMPLTGFSAIVPCGLTLPVSTLAIEADKDITIQQFKDRFIPKMMREFNI